jgi:hypothetical protein
VREAAGRIVVRVGRVVSGLVEVPDAFVLGPAVAMAPARGAAATAPPALAQSTRFQLGDTDVWVELGVDAADDAMAAGPGRSAHHRPPTRQLLRATSSSARSDGDTQIARLHAVACTLIPVLVAWGCGPDRSSREQQRPGATAARAPVRAGGTYGRGA